MYCNNCGAPVPDGSTNCPNCNAALNNQQPNNDGTYYTPPSSDNATSANGSYNQQDFAQQGNYQQSSYQAQDNYFNQNQNQYGYDYSEKRYEDDLQNAKLFGILSLVIGIVVSRIIGIILGAVGLSKANSIPDFMQNPHLAKLKKDAVRLNKLGINIPIVLGVVAIIAYILFVFVFMAGSAAFSQF